jgi:imidazolonepropionase-like amidohydrolase
MPVPDPSRRRLLALGGAAAASMALPRSGRAGGLVDELESVAPDGLSGTYTLRNATVVTHTGARLQGAGVRVEDGEVVEVGTAVTTGLDLGGRWLVPGFTDAGCLVGLYEIGAESATSDRSESSDAQVPDARVVDAYNPLSEVVAVTRAYGITTVLVHPSTGRLIAGQAAFFHTAGRTPAAALVHAPAALVVGLGRSGISGDGPSSRMGVSMMLRDTFGSVELPDDNPDTKRKRKKKGDDAPDSDEDLLPADRIMRHVLQGKVPVLFKAERADDVLTAIDIAREFKLDAAILGGAEAWIVADEMAAAGMPALVGPLTAQPGNFEHTHARYDNAAMLHAAGVRLGFRTGSAHFSRGLSTSAGVAVAHGLPWEAAIAALTAGPAGILGVPDLGRIEPGVPATFFVSAGDPLQPRFPVERVWIRGQDMRMDHRQRRLYERFRKLW